MRALTMDELSFVSGGHVSESGGRFWQSLDGKQVETIIVVGKRGSKGGFDSSDDSLDGDENSFGTCFRREVGDNITSAETLVAAGAGAINLAVYGATWGAAAGVPGVIVGAAGGAIAGAAFGALSATLTNMGYQSVNCAMGWS